MLTYTIENFGGLEAELRIILPERQAEFEIYGPPMESVADFETYHALAKAGILVTIAMRNDNKLIGYWLGIKFPDPHHLIDGRKVMVLMSQVCHILPEWRPKVARGLDAFLDRLAREIGIDLVAQRIRPLERARQFYEARGYRLSELVLVKRLCDA